LDAAIGNQEKGSYGGVRVCKLKLCKRDSKKNYGLARREEERAKHIILRSI
jgi:hypothetical protein